MRLMIVDDEYFAVQGVMEGVNWAVLPYDEVLQAYSYTEAVDKFSTHKIDVLLCDIEMPDENGLELIAWANAHSPDTECIILSCHEEFDYARAAVSLKCMDYVLKPVRYTILTEILSKAAAAVTARNKESSRDYGPQSVEAIAQKAGGDYVDAVETIVDYINSHLSEDLEVRELAAMAYISADHLTRSFKKRFGKTVSDYILEKRMALAGELLRRRDLSITMVSDAVGYGTYSYFTKQFKKIYGMTPREYQKQFWKGKE